MNQEEFSHCLAALEACWPNTVRPWSPGTVQTWEGLWMDLDVAAVLVAIQALATDGREFPPPPGLVRQQVIQLKMDLPTADEAWGEVRKQIAAVGSLRGTVRWQGKQDILIEPRWSNPLIGRVADNFGWDELCQSENPDATRAHFMQMWREAVGRQRSEQARTPMAAALLSQTGIALPNLSADRALGPVDE